jgi:hypothetical protein
MRFLRRSLGLLALGLLGHAALLSAPALAGEGCGLTGFGCDNMCPLAHQANERRALGAESLAVASKVQADLAARVTANLRRI